MSSKFVKVKESRWLKHFMTETPFHGFGLAFNSSSVVEFVGWLLIVCLCAVLAVYQTVCLIQVYHSEPTMTKTTITHHGYLDFRKLHVCFDWNFDPDLSESNLYLSESAESLLLTVTESQLHLFRSGNFTATLFDSRVSRLILAMLTDIVRQETYYYSPDRNWGSHIKDSPFYSTINSAYYQIYSFFASRHISIPQLARFIGFVACEVMEIQISGALWEDTVPTCDAQLVTLLSDNGFCMSSNSSSSELLIDNVHSPLTIVGNSEKIRMFFNETDDSGNDNSLGMDVDLFGSRFGDKGHKYVVHTSYGQFGTTTVDIQGHFRGYSTRRRPCYRPKNATNCRSFCDAESTVEVCGCWQLWWSLVLPLPKQRNIRVCTDGITAVQTESPYFIPDYHSCLRNASVADTLTQKTSECMKTCLDDCSHTKIQFSTDISLVANAEVCRNCTTSLTFTFRSFSYPIVEEVLAKDFETFIAEFGGLLGLWLGGSFIAFSHIFVVFMRAIHQTAWSRIEKYCGNKEPTIQQPE